ncbi:hypothetical protein DMP05_02865 [Slackia isoflavoniconvertens]|uniref:Uncharacterized protein n=1 Tax=Slackia isoflavoniconvertens TaxID=572010 RepID=A0A3N0IIS6_9ACTN|nr:hypothetical protein [Slackia sp.]RNM36182.1 hypothetical protein DMP05_02865 [Slackia isoflavoniconvertens]
MPVIVSTHDAQSATTPAPHKINALCMKNSIEKSKGTLVDAHGKNCQVLFKASKRIEVPARPCA